MGSLVLEVCGNDTAVVSTALCKIAIFLNDYTNYTLLFVNDKELYYS